MFTSIASRLREMRESRLMRLSLQRELAAVTTLGGLSDIEAAISRSEMAEGDPQTQEMRRVLADRRSVLAGWS